MLRTSDALGYAVIDVETTGLRPFWHDRVVEVGIVHLDPAGEWTTLVDPERDLGPQHIYGITAADIRHAPTFGEIAGAPGPGECMSSRRQGQAVGSPQIGSVILFRKGVRDKGGPRCPMSSIG
ncbi:hypothetical protein Pth03_76330 [Planotetraspora thailandica]|uniref:Exonuclease domain-containing protein n=1 Tax=Planotetraspora thailandica TaxID=487172 RepID=A0A8J3Y1U7_9ACTN|nr:hypothetical protein Pth03_76330 [Planotetraspora thailandica]